MSGCEDDNKRNDSMESRFRSLPFGGAGEDTWVEDGPTMRSVATMATITASPFLQSSFEGKGIGKPPSLGFPRPPVGLSRPPAGIARPSLRKLQAQHPEPRGLKKEKEWCGVWNVNNNDLDPLPMDFPLERTHREIPENASVVANRISDALRKLSIEAEYDSEKAKAKCMTDDMVSFRIRLYAGGENGPPVFVEVQRRNGPASSFMRSCRAILAAAEGIAELNNPPAPRAPSFLKKPIREMKFLEKHGKHFPKPEDDVAASLSELENVMELLRSNRRDLNVLGLEKLNFLTDPLKSVPIGALEISKRIVLGNNKQDIREEIRVLTERDIFSPGFGEEEGPVDRSDQVRYLALSIFSHALGLCSQDGSLSKAVEKETWFSEYLIPTLVDELKRVSESANSAYQAACCVQSLVACSPTACRLVIDNGGVEGLGKALKEGELRHELLANEAAMCLKKIDAL